MTTYRAENPKSGELKRGGKAPNTQRKMPPGQGAPGEHKAKPSKVSATKRGERKTERKVQTAKEP